ncbi:hypothetical protein KUCAC02_010382 [Chaenocephalus aceratus]|uniref:Uncharacterized protein n=1 Tax=Chaenocephalus aceratus TaxID=36190 RepID=A0ACB9W0I0_CHAAC|nr:hypothetical protein KUCAC02_010382 [Chaenocephalus aceratus]
MAFTGIGYNLTYMPNQFNHDTQEEVGLEVHQFGPWCGSAAPRTCSSSCAACTPRSACRNYRKPLPPCRSVCERAKRGCSPLMSQYGFEWPERMSCEQLPQLGDEAGPDHPAPLSVDRECPLSRPLVPIKRESHSLYGQVHTGPLPNCAQPCHQPYFSAERTCLHHLLGGTLVGAVLHLHLHHCRHLLIDMERFKYPERPIIFLATCYLFVSLGYIIRLVAGHERVACGTSSSVGGDQLHILYDTTGPALCTLVFLLVYFFGMASSIWWVVLCFSWFLAAGMKWGSEAIAGYSQYFHLAAWLIPSVKTIVVLALSSVDGEPCGWNLLRGEPESGEPQGFVLAPLVVYLFTGSLFLLAGFVSLFRIRSIIKQGGNKDRQTGAADDPHRALHCAVHGPPPPSWWPAWSTSSTTRPRWSERWPAPARLNASARAWAQTMPSSCSNT